MSADHGEMTETLYFMRNTASETESHRPDGDMPESGGEGRSEGIASQHSRPCLHA